MVHRSAWSWEWNIHWKAMLAYCLFSLTLFGFDLTIILLKLAIDFRLSPFRGGTKPSFFASLSLINCIMACFSASSALIKSTTMSCGTGSARYAGANAIELVLIFYCTWINKASDGITCFSYELLTLLHSRWTRVVWPNVDTLHNWLYMLIRVHISTILLLPLYTLAS